MAAVSVERIIPALSPNTNYVFKVRAINGLGVASEWSESVLVGTPGPSAVSPGILVADQANGHTYRIESINGVLSLVLVI